MAPARDGSRRPPSPEDWIDAAIERHARGFAPHEFLKAIRALSTRYVERRADLPTRSALDSPGKRAAFAGFFAPLHYLTVRRIVGALDSPRASVSHLLDLGCGTGVGAAAWAHAIDAAPALTGIDRAAWALDEARWNWHTLGFRFTTRRQSLLDALEAHGRRRTPTTERDGIVLAWSVNELPESDRQQVLPLLVEAHQRGTSVLVIEPLARAAAPWWDGWADSIAAAGARADEWKFPPLLPARLSALDEAAGFRREYLSARSLWLPGV